MEKRNQVIDMARGLGILLVVLGHNPLIWKDSGEWYRIIFSFHMPLFFFLSGTVFNSQKTIKETIADKIDGLLKPYVVILFSIGLIGAIAKHQALAHYVSGAILATGGTILGWTPLWFLPHLFLVALISWILIRAGLNRSQTGHLTLAFSALLLCAGIYMIRFFWQTPISFMGSDHVMNGLPWSIDLLLVTIPYFMLGHFFSPEVKKFHPTKGKTLLALMALGGAHILSNQTIDLNNRQFDGFFFPVLASLGGIYLTLTAAFACQFASKIGQSMSMFGSASLIVLIFHWPIEGGISKLAADPSATTYVPIMWLAFLVGSIAPLLIWQVIQRSTFLSLLLLPARRRKLTQRSAMNA